MMANTEKLCRTCKHPKPLSSFTHQRFQHQVTALCLDCHTGRLHGASQVPPQPPTQDLALSPIPALTPASPARQAEPANPVPATPIAPLHHDFVTQSDLTTSIGELRQFLQDEVTAAIQSITSAIPATQSVYTSGTAPSPIPPSSQQPAVPAPSGEYQPAFTFPWLSTDLIDKVLQDTLSIYDLPKLANPSWPGAAPVDEQIPVLIEGFLVVKAPTTSASNHQFIKAVPNFSTFGWLWVIYLSLPLSTSHNRDLPVCLGHFYQHVADLSKVFPWERVAGYVITVCTSRLSRATAAEWARFDTELHASHFQGVSTHSNSATNAKRPPPRHDNPHHEQVCMSWNQGKCTGTEQRPCIRKHVCLTCGSQHTTKACTWETNANGPPNKVAKAN